MASYNGKLVDEEDFLGLRISRALNGFISDEEDELIICTRTAFEANGIIDVDNDNTLFVQRQTKIIVGVLIKPFHWDEDVPLEQRGIRQPTAVQGFIESLNENPRPRRYPLELSWRSPLRQK